MERNLFYRLPGQPVASSSGEVRGGADTPPEKMPRQIPPANHLCECQRRRFFALLQQYYAQVRQGSKQENHGLDNVGMSYGFDFVDCAALRFWIGSIEDAACSSDLGALLMQMWPKEVIYESQGPTAPQLTPVLPATTGFADASEITSSAKKIIAAIGCGTQLL
ncbi:unnamed protein product [Linum trigynum]|uniref:Uncharacterized protein n=1 Tax=Linum trigynum TaxID=586398 RepID=A0AAV2CSS2_9ROSI